MLSMPTGVSLLVATPLLDISSGRVLPAAAAAALVAVFAPGAWLMPANGFWFTPAPGGGFEPAAGFALLLPARPYACQALLTLQLTKTSCHAYIRKCSSIGTRHITRIRPQLQLFAHAGHCCSGGGVLDSLRQCYRQKPSCTRQAQN